MESLDAYREIKGVTENAIEEGRNSEKTVIAKKMIMENFQIDMISNITELSIEIIENLTKELKQPK